MSIKFNDEYEIEPIAGLPEPLPKGENILWQGRPQRKAVLRNVLHIRKFALYFGVLLVWNVGTAFYDGRPGLSALGAGLGTLGLAAAFYIIVQIYAYLIERTTIYTLTDKRVVMRCGVALSVAFQLPFKQITAADVRSLQNGMGDIALTLAEHSKISWLVLYPHVRPWKLAKPQPMLRCIDNVAHIAQMLADGLAAAHGHAPAHETAEAAHGPSAPQPISEGIPAAQGLAQSA
ncbi:MAG: photosynthetic complex putative assembly protein PuhB [Pseudomonadota bacterium]